MKVTIGDDYIEILEDKVTNEYYEGQIEETEIVYWHQDEWLEDPESVVPAIANAIHLAHTNPQELKRLLNK